MRGSFHGYSSERDDCSTRKISHDDESHSAMAIVEATVANLSRQQQQHEQLDENGGLPNGKKNLEDYTTNRKNYFRLSFSSGSSADEAHHHHHHHPSQKKEEQPVDSSGGVAASPVATNQQKKCSTSAMLPTTTMPSSAAATETSAIEGNTAASNGGMSFLRSNFPFFRNSTSRSRSQSVISDVSRSSETGDSKKDKDKSYRRKSHLNRAFTDEPVPDSNFQYDATRKSSKPTSQEASSLESSAMEETRGNPKPSVKLHPAIPLVLTTANNKSDTSLNKSTSRNRVSQNFESTPSPVPTTKNQSIGKVHAAEQQTRKGSPVVKKDSFSDAEGVSFIKKMLQKESDRDRAAAAAAGKQSSQPGSGANANGNHSAGGGYNLKKSPSAGNQSYWSKFSSSQSAFLRKLFEKPKVSDSPMNLNPKGAQKGSSINNTTTTPTINGNRGNQADENCGEKDSSEKENAEPVLGFSVAQKASFFMKLEHEQRFSKWRKNSVDLGSIGSTSAALEQLQGNGSVNANNVGADNNPSEFRPRSSRHLIQPITPPTDLKDLAPLVNNISSGENHGNGTSAVEFGSSPTINTWTNNHYSSVGNSVTNSPEKINNDDPSTTSKSFYKDYDDIHKYEPNDRSCVKARVDKFDEFVPRKLEPMPCYPVAPPTPTMKSYSLTRSSRNTGTNAHNVLSNLGGFPMYHSASAIINTSSSNGKHCGGGGGGSNKSSGNFYINSAAAYNNSSSSSSFSEAMSRQENSKFLPLTTSKATNMSKQDVLAYENCNGIGCNNRRGSGSEMEMPQHQQHLGAGHHQSPILCRPDKVKSMFISSRSGYHHCDPETLSEDGEFSSGGQEVAEIICRSYENSPIFRKKNWRSQKHSQANFTKEIWRRCGNYENWNQRSQTNPPHQQQRQPHHHHQLHPVQQTFTATTNVIEVSAVPPTSTSALPPVAQSPPTTSNLLQILTVLSSSNDELSESKSKSKKHRQGGGGVAKQKNGFNSIPPIHPGHLSNYVVVEPRASTASSISNPAIVHSGPNLTQGPVMPSAPVVGSDQIFVSVPHPEDEAFQSFFCSVKSYTQVTHYPAEMMAATSSGMINGQVLNNGFNEDTISTSADSSSIGDLSNGPLAGAVSSNNESLDISSVRRESDLLVMKKNVPTAKRKSGNGKYKNPLRALAARIDFRQQGYTQQNHSNANTVQNGSDVDVTT